MHTLNFTLTPEGVSRIHDAVLCLAKFSETVSMEARHSRVRETILPIAPERQTVTDKLSFQADPCCFEFFQDCLCFVLT